MQIYKCMNECKNEYMGNINVRSECFDRCNLMLRMSMRILMLEKLGS